MIEEVSKVYDNSLELHKLNILDCRPYLNAVGNRLKGGGFESTA
jgi:hypothetical protein